MFYEELLEESSYNVAMIDELFFKQTFKFTHKLKAKEQNFATFAELREQSGEFTDSALMDNSDY